MNLTEAFKALDNLEEDVFSVNDEGIEKLQNFVKNDDSVDELSVYDLELEDEREDTEDCHVGDAVLDCCVCHSKLFKPVSEVIIDDETQVANKGEECPYCYSVDGFKVVGEVTPFEDTEDIEVEVEDKDVVEEDIDQVDVSTDDVDIEIEDKDDESEETVEDEVVVEESKQRGKWNKGQKTITIKETTRSNPRLVTKKGSIANLLAEHMNELQGINDVNELKNRVFEIVDNSDIASTYTAKEFKYRVSTQRTRYGVLGTIGAYMYGKSIRGTHESINRKSRKKEAANESCKRKSIKESSDITLEAKYEMYPDGRITSTRVTGTDEFDAFANLLDEVGSYVTSDDVLDMQDEGATIEDVVEQIQSMNGDGSDFIFSIKNITTGKKYFDLNESCTGISTRDKRESINRKSRKLGKYVVESDNKDETIGDKLKKYQMWVDYDMEHYGKVSETTQEIIDKEGLQLIKDQYGDYEVSVGHYKAESFCKSKKGKYVKEDIDEIEISSDDMEIKVKPKDEECEECEEETVSPVSEETIDEIEINNVDKDMVDEVTEECLKENFNNVKFFRSNNITKRNNKLIVEGVIGFKSGKKKNTKFMFESYKTNRDKVVFLGENKDVTKNKSLSLVGKVVRGKLISESMKLK